MCDPVSLTIAAAGTQAVGAGVSAIQSAAMSRYQAKVADRNAKLEAEAGRNVRARTSLEAVRLSRRIAQTKGQQIASMAANGIALDSGSALQVQQDTAMIGAEDMQQLYAGGDQEVRSFDIRGSNARAQARASRAEASAALVKGAFDVASTVLGGANQVSQWKAKVKAGTVAG